MEGLLGLTTGIQDRDAAVRDIGMLERMDQRVQADKNAEVAAQQQEQMFYEQIYNMSDQLLEKDRKAVNKKVMLAQQQLRGHLSDRGGSRKDFLEAGGMSVMNEIKNGIMRSDEVGRYQSNKQNLAKILEAKEKGLGHLLSPKDLKSAEDYEKNEEGGAISYSGMMTEIKMPPKEGFDYGTNIPIANILSYDGNAMRIKANYKIVHPDRPEPDNKELAAFAVEMGYGGVGTNENQLRAQLAESKKRAEYEKTKETDKDKISVLNNWTTFTSQMENVKVSDLIAEPGSSLVDKKKAEKNQAANQLFGEKSKITSLNRSLSTEGDLSSWNPASWIGQAVGSVADFITQDKMGLQGSHHIALDPSSLNKMNALVFDGHEMKDGEVLNFQPNERMFKANGKKAGPKEFSKGNYKIRGTVSGYYTTSGKGDDAGEEFLLMEAYDDDGKTVDPKATAKLHQKEDGTISDSQAKMSMYTVVENEDGDVVYIPLEVEKYPQRQEVLANAMGADDNITNSVELRQKAVDDINKIESQTTEKQIQFQTAIVQAEKEVFQDPIFAGEGEKYFGDNKAQNRYPLMKSFYLAVDEVENMFDPNAATNQGVDPKVIKSFVDEKFFTRSAASFGIEDDLRKYEQGNSDDFIIGKWFQNMESQYEKGTLQHKRHALLANKWLQIRQHYK